MMIQLFWIFYISNSDIIWIGRNVKRGLMVFSMRVNPKLSQVQSWLVTGLFDSSQEFLHQVVQLLSEPAHQYMLG